MQTSCRNCTWLYSFRSPESYSEWWRINSQTLFLLQLQLFSAQIRRCRTAHLIIAQFGELIFLFVGTSWKLSGGRKSTLGMAVASSATHMCIAEAGDATLRPCMQLSADAQLHPHVRHQHFLRNQSSRPLVNSLLSAFIQLCHSRRHFLITCKFILIFNTCQVSMALPFNFNHDC